MGSARVRVSAELLRQALGFPGTAKVYWIEPSDLRQNSCHEVIVYVSSPDLPDVPEAQLPPEICPTMKEAETRGMALNDRGLPQRPA